MSRKKKTIDELYEDEKIIPPEENNCFGFIDGKCCVYALNKMTAKDKVYCGTVRCPFYKPEEHADSIKHITDKGIVFETFEEFEKKTGLKILRRDELDEYENYPHAKNEVTDEGFFNYVKKTRCFKSLTSADLKQYARYIGITVDGMQKKEMIAAIENFT